MCPWPVTDPLISCLSSHVVRTHVPVLRLSSFQDICNSFLLCFSVYLSFTTRLPWPQALSSCLEVDVQRIDTLLRPCCQPARCTLAILCFMNRCTFSLLSSLKCDDPSEIYTRSIASPTPQSSCLGIPGSFWAKKSPFLESHSIFLERQQARPSVVWDSTSPDCFLCLLMARRVQKA